MPAPSLAPDGAPDAGAGARAAAETTGRSVLAGGAWTALSLVVPQLLVLVVSASAARFLGPDLLGRQSFIAFVQITVISLATLGLPVSLMRTVAAAVGEGRAAQTRGLLSWAQRVILATSLVGGALVAGGALLSDHDRLSWLLAGYVTVVVTMQTVPGAVLVGLQRWRQATMAGVVTGFADALLVIVLLARGGGIASIFAVQAVVATTNLVWTGALARRALAVAAPVSSPPGALIGQVVRFARPNAALTLLETVVRKRSEFFFLARYSSDSEIAQYSIAFAAVNALAQVPNAMTSLASSFATLYSAGEHARLRGGFARGCRLLLTVTIPLAAAMAALGPALIELVYGSDYARAATVLGLLLITLPLVPIAAISDAMLIGRGDISWLVRSLTVAVPVNLVLAALLVPSQGAVGAAIANVVAQLVAGVPVVLLVFRRIGVSFRELALSLLVRSAAVAASAAVLARSADDAVGGTMGLVVGVAAFAASWLGLAVLCRVLSRSDGLWLQETLQARLGRPARMAVAALTARAEPTA